MRVQLWDLPRRPRANFNETLAELRSAPPEEMAEFMRAVQSILEVDRAEVTRLELGSRRILRLQVRYNGLPC